MSIVFSQALEYQYRYMEPIGAAAIYDLSGINGELLLSLLIAFGLGALFGRTIMSPRARGKQLRLFAPSHDRIVLPAKKDERVIITPAPRSNS